MNRSMRLLVVVFALIVVSGFARAQATSNATPSAGPTVKILAIGHIVATPAAKNRPAIMPSEVRETVKLYLAGKIDQWYSRKDQPGVVFVMNVSSIKEAHDLLESLPLGKAGIMEFDLIPLGPLAPLQYLVNDPAPAKLP